jgi:hypothetical protein
MVEPRLQARLQKQEAAEYLAEWRAQYEMLKVKRDALAAELREVYPMFVAKMVDLFSRIGANDSECSQLHRARPAGVKLHLDNPELVTRGLERFTRDNPAIAQELRLPDFEQSARTAWPPRRPFDPGGVYS